MSTKSMTEAEWVVCTDVERMLHFLFKSTTRKRHLFACACCRRIWALLTDERSRVAVQVAEARYADKKPFTRQQIRDAQTAAKAAVDEATSEAARQAALAAADALSAGVCGASHYRLAFSCASAVGDAAGHGWWLMEIAAQAVLVRDIWGPLPFRSFGVNPAWLEWQRGTIPKLAAAIYDERRFQDLPVLADALEEAGCRDEDILSHCRTEGEHVRGCWVVDLGLGKK